jgi:dienelactone hydrolase
MNVLAGRPEYATADESYWRSLLRHCREQSWRRRQKLREFSSSGDWERHCTTVRQRFRAALGPLPDRTPLNSRLVDVLEREDYVVEKLVIESQPSLFVSVNLYRPPTVTSPAPAILNPVGHWRDSKAQDVVQARGISLARKGYVALVFDPIGQGERSQFWDAGRGAIPISLGTSQHAAVCNPCFLIGQTLINYMAWDGIRLLDYLESRPDVDANRIGCTGASGGGTYTIFLAALDPRITVAVPVCSTSTYERMLAQGQIGEPCQNPFASYRDDLDVADLLMSAAPAAIRIIAGTYDFFPLIGARDVYLDVRDCYTALEVPDRVDLVEVPAHHDYNQAMRESAYAWFNRWLKQASDARESPCAPEAPERLWCTLTGQLLTSLGGETVLTLNRARTRTVAAPSSSLETLADAKSQRTHVRSAVPVALGISELPTALPCRILDRTTVDRIAVEHIVFEYESEVPIPGLVFAPSGDGPHPAILFLDDRGKAAEAAPDGIAVALARTGYLTLAVDLRGWGETAWWKRFPHHPDGNSLLGNDSMLAYASYLLGIPPLTQRLGDAHGAIDVLANRADVDRTRIGVIGRGVGGVVALHLAALDDRIGVVAAFNAVGCYRSLIESDHYRFPPSAFVPGILLHYDLPELAGALSPTPALIANPVDALGQDLPKDAALDLYTQARRMRELLGDGAGLQFLFESSRADLNAGILAWASALLPNPRS